MKCPFCNQEIPDSSLFCLFCSQKISGDIMDSNLLDSKEDKSKIYNHCIKSNSHNLDASNIKYGGFWSRFVAYCIDKIFLGFLKAIIIKIYGLNDLLKKTISFIDDPYNYTYEDTAGIFFVSAIVWIMFDLIYWLYYALMNSSRYKATLGKMALGIIVVDKNYQRISFARATGRYFACAVSWITLGVGFIIAAFHPKKQTLHDIIVDTFVIKRS